jgi:integrase
MAEVHVAKIVEHFGPRRLDSIQPSDIKSWVVKLQGAGFADSYVYALHGRMSQVLADAVHDGVLARSPASRRTSPRAGTQRPYVATTEQMWALHDALDERYRAGLLLAALAGLRLAEVCGLRIADVDFMRGVVSPVVQYPAQRLKTSMSMTAIPIPADLALVLSAHVARYSTDWIMANERGAQMGPWQLQRAFRAARDAVPGLPAGFRFHDLRHYYASLLISSGLDVKVVQTRLRHTSGKTTIDTYGHLWPDSDDSTRAAINSVMTARRENPADSLRTEGQVKKRLP